MPRWRRRRFARQRRKFRDVAIKFVAGIDFAMRGSVNHTVLTIAALNPRTREVHIHGQVLVRKAPDMIPLNIKVGDRVEVNGGK